MTKSLPMVTPSYKEIFKLKMSVYLTRSRTEFTALALIKEKEDSGKISNHHSILSMPSELFECEEETKMAG